MVMHVTTVQLTFSLYIHGLKAYTVYVEQEVPIET